MCFCFSSAATPILLKKENAAILAKQNQLVMLFGFFYLPRENTMACLFLMHESKKAKW